VSTRPALLAGTSWYMRQSITAINPVRRIDARIN